MFLNSPAPSPAARFFVLVLGVLGTSGTSCSRREHREREAARPNLVLILVDTLRPDHLDLYGYGRATSPNLAAFAREAVTFENAYASSVSTLARRRTSRTSPPKENPEDRRAFLAVRLDGATHSVEDDRRGEQTHETAVAPVEAALQSLLTFERECALSELRRDRLPSVLNLDHDTATLLKDANSRARICHVGACVVK